MVACLFELTPAHRDHVRRDPKIPYYFPGAHGNELVLGGVVGDNDKPCPMSATDRQLPLYINLPPEVAAALQDQDVDVVALLRDKGYEVQRSAAPDPTKPVGPKGAALATGKRAVTPALALRVARFAGIGMDELLAGQWLSAVS